MPETIKTVYGIMKSSPPKSVNELSVNDYFVLQDSVSGYYGKEVYRVLGFEDDKRAAGESSYGGWLHFNKGTLVCQVFATENKEIERSVEKKYLSFTEFFDAIGFTDINAEDESPSLIPDFKDVPVGSVCVRVGHGFFGNGPTLYSITPFGLVYKWENGFQHGGLTPWRFKGWSKWHKGENCENA